MSPKFLLAAVCLTHSLLLAGNTGFNPSPVSTFDGSPTTTLGEVSYTQPADNGGVAVARDGTDYYVASGPKLTKFDQAGSVLWTREYSVRAVTIGEDELRVTNYYESWGDGNEISPGAGTDDGEIMNLSARRVISSSGAVFVYFLDRSRPYRGLVVRFSSTGQLNWRHPTSYPLGTVENGYYMPSTDKQFLLDFVLVTSSSALAVVESFTYGDFYLTDSGQTLSASVMTRVTVFDADPGSTDGNGEYLLTPTQYGAQNKRAYAVGLARNTGGTLYFATQEGPTGIPLEEADQLIFRSIPSPYTSISGTTATYASDRAREEWNDIGFGQDGNIYLGGTSPFDTGRSKARQIVASFTSTAAAERWTTEIIPVEPLDTVRSGATGLEIMVYGDDGVYVAGDTSRDIYSRLSLAKVDFDGNQLWSVNSYDAPDGGVRKAYCPMMDSDGSIYFIGAEDTGSFALWKFSSEGVFQFAAPQAAPSGSVFNQDAVALGGLPFNDAIYGGMSSRVDLTANPHTFKLVKFSDTAVVKAPNEITVNVAPSGSVTQGDVVEFTATASSGLPVTYSVHSGTASITGNTVTYSTAGTVTVRVSQGGNGTYEAATPVDVTVNVIGVDLRSTQSINLPSISTKEFSVTPFRLNASASSGLPVSLSVSGAAVGSGSTITMKTIGKVTVTATQAGNSSYHAASAVTRTFTIRDSTDPKISGVPSSGKTSRGSYTIGGTASDNHQVVTLKYRVKPPGGNFGSLKTVRHTTPIGGSKRFSISIPLPDAGKYAVELFATDKSNNRGSLTKSVITKEQ